MADISFFFTLALASIIMVLLMGVGVIVTMPFHGALVRLRANYNPRAVGLEGVENRVGPTLTTLFGTLKRVKRLEGWYGLYKGAYPMLMFTTLISICSIIFVGGSSTRGPRGTYSVPEAGGFQMGIFTILLTLISLPMTVIVNRSIITPYKLPTNPRQSLSILLSPTELKTPWILYLTPGLLLVTVLHSLCVTLVARTIRLIFLGAPDAGDAWNNVSMFRWGLFIIWQAGAAGWLTPLEVVATRLSVQPNTSGASLLNGYMGVGGSSGNAVEENGEENVPEGVEYCGSGEDVIGLRPTSEPYEGLLDCGRKIIQEEGMSSLWRGWWWTMFGNVAAVFS